ncbi:unnamed protein product [Strongylus vulgaris]|uniref:Uncharacterized protein n=1 Tax=Strongylus vulgaris TaxID=40348 RepID=A0A3P7M3U1_STRVU|nr:unnamed protein product [Strongylus vulgaris]
MQSKEVISYCTVSTAIKAVYELIEVPRVLGPPRRAVVGIAGIERQVTRVYLANNTVVGLRRQEEAAGTVPYCL